MKNGRPDGFIWRWRQTSLKTLRQNENENKCWKSTVPVSTWGTLILPELCLRACPQSFGESLFPKNAKKLLQKQTCFILRLPYDSIVASLNEHFHQTLNIGRIPEFIKDFADYYTETEETIRKRLLESYFVHVDETTISIQGVNWYVWVFTNEKYVVFKLQETREATIVHEFLANYNGILISDFYAGYDSVECRQQKCWVHLIRDLNDDLRESPFDIEYENFVLEVRSLIIPIMEAVQKYGLKKRNLDKFTTEVDKFCKKVITDRNYKSELTIKYRKRFIRYRDILHAGTNCGFTLLPLDAKSSGGGRRIDHPSRASKNAIYARAQYSLFTFLQQDGIPWHNNAAERALRHIAKQRVIVRAQDIANSFEHSSYFVEGSGHR